MTKDDHSMHLTLTVITCGGWGLLYWLCYQQEKKRVTFHYDSTCKQIRIGSCVKFRGKNFTIKDFKSMYNGGPAVIFNEEITHTEELPYEYNIDLVEY